MNVVCIPRHSASTRCSTCAYLEQHGKPVAFYSDKHGIFRVNSKDAVGGDGVTQFGRALLTLNIDIICANSPQAKGPSRARVRHIARPPGEGTAAGRGIIDHRPQYAFRSRPGQCQGPASGIVTLTSCGQRGAKDGRAAAIKLSVGQSSPAARS